MKEELYMDVKDNQGNLIRIGQVSKNMLLTTIH